MSREMTALQVRAAEIVSVSAHAFGVQRIAAETLAAAKRVLDHHAHGRLYLPRTLQWAHGVVDAAK